MKKLLALVVLAGSVTLYSCNNEKKTEETSTMNGDSTTMSTMTTTEMTPAPMMADSSMEMSKDSSMKMENGKMEMKVEKTEKKEMMKK